MCVARCNQSVIASSLFYAVVCRGAGIKAGDPKRLNKLIKKASFVIGVDLDMFEVDTERRILSKLLTITNNTSHPLHDMLAEMRCTLSNR